MSTDEPQRERLTVGQHWHRMMHLPKASLSPWEDRLLTALCLAVASGVLIALLLWPGPVTLVIALAFAVALWRVWFALLWVALLVAVIVGLLRLLVGH